ncbi:MAG: hypothetical protein ACI9KE_003835 [Polyangiales bacterium]|jgi:hypothetical protein
MKPFALLTLGFFAFACTVTDTGNPPASPDIDPDLVENDSTSTGSFTLRGLPGAVFPAEGVLRITPFGLAPPRTVTVQPDGSFEVVIDFAADGNDALRVQVVQGALRSEPLDFDPAGRLSASPGCLIMRAWSQVLLDETNESTFAVEMTNECEESIEFGEPRLHPDGPFTLLPATVDDLASGASSTLTLRVQRAESGEDLVFIPIRTPTSTTRVITLVVHNP